MARARQWRFEHGVTTVSSLAIAIGCGAGHLYASCEGIAEDDSTAMSLLALSLLLPLTSDFQKSIAQYPNINTGEDFKGYE